MRVIAGKARRIQLSAPEGMNTRPTTDRIKETLFNMLNPYLYECDFLDLFSGSGAIGIEALSRGARRSVFVDSNSNACQCILENLKKTKLQEQAVLMKLAVNEALMRLESEKESFDFVFMDPPYNHGMEKEVLLRLKELELIHKKTIIIIEVSLQTDLSYIKDTIFKIDKEKKYKTNKHVFLKVR